MFKIKTNQKVPNFLLIIRFFNSCTFFEIFTSLKFFIKFSTFLKIYSFYSQKYKYLERKTNLRITFFEIQKLLSIEIFLTSYFEIFYKVHSLVFVCVYSVFSFLYKKVKYFDFWESFRNCIISKTKFRNFRKLSRKFLVIEILFFDKPD